MTRPFTKPALSAEQQVELLRSRGLVIDDALAACERLGKIGYYRFSGYALPFEIEGNPRTHRFRPGYRFEDIIAIYEFDRSFG
jgi:abortive infection bacteriophage resistance protein